MNRELKDIECKCCERKSSGLYYKGLVPWGYYCSSHAAHYGLTKVLANAVPRPVQTSPAC